MKDGGSPRGAGAGRVIPGAGAAGKGGRRAIADGTAAVKPVRRPARPRREEPPSDPGTDRRVVVLGLARMADALGNSFLIVVLPLYIASGRVTGNGLGLSEPLITGIVLGLFGIVSAAAQPLAGRLSDRAGRRRAFVLIGLGGFAVANVAFAAVDSYVGLLTVRALQGVSAALTITASLALVNELSILGGRGANMGTYNALRLVGFGTGPLVAGIVVEAGPYHLPGLPELSGFDAAFFGAAAAAVLSAALVVLFVRDPDETRPTRERVALRIRDPEGERWLDPVFALGMVTLLMAACIALLAPIEPAVNARLDQGPFLFAVEFSALIGSLAVVQPVVGRLSDRHGRRPFVFWGLVALAPATLVQGLVTEPWMMIAARMAQGVSAAFVFAPALALAGDLAEEGQSGAQLSVLTVSFGLGLSAGQLLTGSTVRFGFVVPFTAGAGLALLGAVLVATQVPPRAEGAR